MDLAEIPRQPARPPPPSTTTHNVYAIARRRAAATSTSPATCTTTRSATSRAGGPARRTGEARPAPSGSSESVTYPAFTALPDGTLLFWRRTASPGEGDGRRSMPSTPGRGAGDRSAPCSTGAPSGESPYLHHVAVDPAHGRHPHHVRVARRPATSRRTNDVGYARSLDGGRTWERATGRPARRPDHPRRAPRPSSTPTDGSGLLQPGRADARLRGRSARRWSPSTLPGGDRRSSMSGSTDGDWRRERSTNLGARRPPAARRHPRRARLAARRPGQHAGGDRRHARIGTRLADREIARGPARLGGQLRLRRRSPATAVEMLIPDGDRPHVVEAPLAEP